MGVARVWKQDAVRVSYVLPKSHQKAVQADMPDKVGLGGASGEEIRFFHSLAQKWTPLSDEIRSVRFKFGEDTDGAPAVWVSVIVPPDLKPSKAKISALQQATESFKNEILESASNRWPYVNIETE